MNSEENKQLAKSLEKDAEDLLREMTQVLAKRGIVGVQVVSFAAGEVAAAPFEMADGSPCPVRCVVLPDGRIRCEPLC